jgi:hypothetical protein
MEPILKKLVIGRIDIEYGGNVMAEDFLKFIKTIPKRWS